MLAFPPASGTRVRRVARFGLGLSAPALFQSPKGEPPPVSPPVPRGLATVGTRRSQRPAPSLVGWPRRSAPAPPASPRVRPPRPAPQYEPPPLPPPAPPPPQERGGPGAARARGEPRAGAGRGQAGSGRGGRRHPGARVAAHRPLLALRVPHPVPGRRSLGRRGRAARALRSRRSRLFPEGVAAGGSQSERAREAGTERRDPPWLRRPNS